MPETFKAKKPYFIPGYTGHCPFVSNFHGITYGLATKMILKKNPRVASILKDHEKREEESETSSTNSKPSCKGQVLFSAEVIPGYTGHVPRRKFADGITYGQECIKGVEEFNKICCMNNTLLEKELSKAPSTESNIPRKENALNLLKTSGKKDSLHETKKI